MTIPPPHCITCTCTCGVSSSPDHTAHTSPQASTSTPTNTLPSTVALLMRAVYFSTGPFADAVDRVRNNSALWPYAGTRQAENGEERRREWEGMMRGWRGRVGSGENGEVDVDGEVPGGEEGDKAEVDGNEMGGGLDEGLEGKGKGGGVGRLEELIQELRERGQTGSNDRGRVEVPTQEQVPRGAKNEEAKQETKQEKQEKQPDQTQPTWTEVQRRNSPAKRTKPAEVGRVRQPVLQGQRRTALDIFEFEARRPNSGW